MVAVSDKKFQVTTGDIFAHKIIQCSYDVIMGFFHTLKF